MRKIIISLIAIVAIAGGAYAVVHNSSTTSTPASTGNSSTQSSTGSSAGIVQTKTDSSQGQYLADGNGKPVYTFGLDTSGVSNCTGTCLINWPVYGPASSSASLPTNVTVIQRSDSKAQYAYKGLPLYYFDADGSTPTGDGIANFHLAKP